MELRFRGEFNRDVDDIRNRQVLDALRDAVLNIENASDISRIHNIKKLRKLKNHYRIRVADNYRAGIIIRGKTVWFARFGHRSCFYKSFP